MAWTTPPTYVAGAILTAAQMNAVSGNFDVLAPFTAAWTPFTPTLTQPGAIAKTTNHASYVQVGKLVTVAFHLTATGAGTAANSMAVGLPVASAVTTLLIGSGAIYDASAGTTYSGQWFNTTATSVIFVGDWSGPNSWGVTPAIALANNDIIRGTLTYQAA